MIYNLSRVKQTIYHLQRHINIATVYSEKTDYTSALAYLQRALNIKLQHLPTNHLEFGLLYNNIGTVYMKRQSFIDAHASFKHALNIYLQHSLSNTTEIATLCSNIGALLQINGEYKLSKENYENSLVFVTKRSFEYYTNQTTSIVN
jgi:tetratricopeptide (TPR) repeat protein